MRHEEGRVGERREGAVAITLRSHVPEGGAIRTLGDDRV